VVAAVLLAVLALTAAVQRDLLRGQLPELDSGFKAVSGHAVASKMDAGFWLHDHLPAGAVIASGEAGAIGWLNPGMTLIDCNGLMDRAIARRRRAGLPFDASYVFARRPDAILLLEVSVDSSSLRAAGADYQQALLADPRFARAYQPAARFGDIAVYLRRAAEHTP
jgi:hypothetical protein